MEFDSRLVFGNHDKSNFNKAMNMNAHLERVGESRAGEEE